MIGPIGLMLAARDSTTRRGDDYPIMTRALNNLYFDETVSQDRVLKETMRAVDAGEITLAEAELVLTEHADRCRALGTL